MSYDPARDPWASFGVSPSSVRRATSDAITPAASELAVYGPIEVVVPAATGEAIVTVVPVRNLNSETRVLRFGPGTTIYPVDVRRVTAITGDSVIVRVLLP